MGKRDIEKRETKKPKKDSKKPLPIQELVQTVEVEISHKKKKKEEDF
jgi:hypothetical protein